MTPTSRRAGRTGGTAAAAAIAVLLLACTLAATTLTRHDHPADQTGARVRDRPRWAARPARSAQLTPAQRAAARRDQSRERPGRRPDEPDPYLPNQDPGAQRPVTSATGTLAGSLPRTQDGWRLSLQAVSAARGVWVISALRADGRPGTLIQARRAVARLARREGDDPSAYTVLVPMAALSGAHARQPR